MDPNVDDVIDHYQSVQREEERLSGGLGELELIRTRDILRHHLPAPPARVIDVGGATGVHARWLADDGYTVHVVDLTPRHVEKTAADLGERGVTAELGDARQLNAADGSFDAALLLGPLYHLVDRADRLKAWREAARVVRPGGLVAAAAISRFASLFDGLARELLFDPQFQAVVEADLATGQHRNPDRKPHWFTTAYFHRPEELEAEAVEAGLESVEVAGVEGLASWMPHLADRWADEQSRRAIIESARLVEAEPAVLGVSPHLLAVARTRL